jgi:hypothetical protein
LFAFFGYNNLIFHLLATESVSKMSKNRFTFSIAAGIAVVMLFLTVGTGATAILLNTAHAQSATLGEPFFVEKGTSTAQGEIGPSRTQYTYTANGTMNGTIEVTSTGDYVSVSKGNNLFYEQGRGVITTMDGSEMANYTFIDVVNGTDYQGLQHGTQIPQGNYRFE